MAAELYLVRHGGTAWAHTGQHTGRTDVALLPEGEEEARQLGQMLRGIDFAAAWSSDLQRALRTAQLAGFERPRVTPLLREFDYGEYEGLTTDQIRRQRPGWEIYRDGCPGGESPAQVAARGRAFLAEMAGVEGRVAVFSHGHFLRALATAWVDYDITAATSLALDTAAVSVMRESSRGRVIQRWNWTPGVAAP